MFSTDCPSTEIYSAGSRAVYSFCGCPSALRTWSGSQLLWPPCFHNSLNEMFRIEVAYYSGFRMHQKRSRSICTWFLYAPKGCAYLLSWTAQVMQDVIAKQSNYYWLRDSYKSFTNECGTEHESASVSYLPLQEAHYFAPYSQRHLDSLQAKVPKAVVVKMSWRQGFEHAVATARFR